MIMISEPYFNMVKSLADYEPFRIVLSASEDQIERQRHMEYASRFLVHTYIPYDGKHDVEDYIDNGIVQLAEAGPTPNTEAHFRKTFDLLSTAFGSNTLRRMEQDKHQGRVSLAAFECIAVGVGKNIDEIEAKGDPIRFVQERVQQFWKRQELSSFFTPGLREPFAFSELSPLEPLCLPHEQAVQHRRSLRPDGSRHDLASERIFGHEGSDPRSGYDRPPDLTASLYCDHVCPLGGTRSSLCHQVLSGHRSPERP